MIDGYVPMHKLNKVYNVLLSFIVKDDSLDVEYKSTVFKIIWCICHLNYDFL